MKSCLAFLEGGREFKKRYRALGDRYGGVAGTGVGQQLAGYEAIWNVSTDAKTKVAARMAYNELAQRNHDRDLNSHESGMEMARRDPNTIYRGERPRLSTMKTWDLEALRRE